MKDTYTIGGKTFQLEPLKGKKARRMLPRIMEIASAAFNLAASNNVDLLALFGKDAPKPSLAELTKAMYSIASFFKDEYDAIESEIFPVLLSVKEKDWVWIENEASPAELYTALWVAIKYHIETSFGVEVQDALKNLPTETQDYEAKAEA